MLLLAFFVCSLIPFGSLFGMAHCALCRERIMALTYGTMAFTLSHTEYVSIGSMLCSLLLRRVCTIILPIAGVAMLCIRIG